MTTTRWDVYLDGKLQTSTHVYDWCRELNSSHGFLPFREKLYTGALPLLANKKYAGDIYYFSMAAVEQWLLINSQRLTLGVYYQYEEYELEYHKSILPLLRAFLSERYNVSLNDADGGYNLIGDKNCWPAFYWAIYFLRCAENLTPEEAPQDLRELLVDFQIFLEANEDDDDSENVESAEEQVEAYDLLIEGKEPPAEAQLAMGVGPIYAYSNLCCYDCPYTATSVINNSKLELLLQEFMEEFNAISL